MNNSYFFYWLRKPFKSWRNKYLKKYFKKESVRNDLYQKAICELSDYTGESNDLIRKKHHAGPETEKSFHVFENQDSLTKASVEKFYKECSYYLYELPLWNAECSRPAMIYAIICPYLRQFGCKKVLDFGGGAGDLCLELANNDLDVSYCDIGEELFKFADWRFKRREFSINMYKGLESLGNQLFDCIVSFDAFEHVKDLKLVLNRLAGHLERGGLLIFSEAFSGGLLHLEENEVYHEFKNSDRLLVNCGFEFVDKFAQYHVYKRVE